MLTISPALNAGQAATYHKLDYASSTQSYYQQGEEVKGEWRGELAASLGLPARSARLPSTVLPKDSTRKRVSRW